jgi:hypothetical protein
VTIRDARTKDPIPKVEVKVIGSADAQFVSGATDLRGVFLAEGPAGVITVLARREPGQYAFYRGSRNVIGNANLGGMGGSGGGHARGTAKPAQQGEQSLDANLKMQNSANTLRQVERLQQRYAPPANQPPGAAAGEFK